MGTTLRATLFSILFAAVAACSGADRKPPDGPFPDGGKSDGGTALPDGGGGGGGSDGGLALRGACATLSARRCEYLQRCGVIEPGEYAARDCIAFFTATWCGPSRWPARVEAGTLRYDAQLAQSCADAFAQRACSDWKTEPAACRAFLLPGSFLTQPCYGENAECREGVCRGSSCPRKCQLPGNVSEDCARDDDCRTDGGLYCKLSAAGAGKCTAYGAVNSPCDPQAPCAAGFFCNAQLVCEAKRASGESCIEGACVDTAWCLSRNDGGVCMDKVGADAPCTDDSQCVNGFLCLDETGRCALQGPIPQDGACSYRQGCTLGTVCVGATATALGVCLPPVPEGGACTSSADCAPHLSCAPSDGGSECAPRLEDGFPCVLNRDCRVFSTCAGQSCTPLPLPGSPCLNGQCLFGACETAGDGGRVCVGLGGPGASCLVDSECASNRCLHGQCMAACAP
ncbi:MAG: hypothetical protein ACOZIN_20695 [Myxococcota bacterium]